MSRHSIAELRRGASHLELVLACQCQSRCRHHRAQTHNTETRPEEVLYCFPLILIFFHGIGICGVQPCLKRHSLLGLESFLMSGLRLRTCLYLPLDMTKTKEGFLVLPLQAQVSGKVGTVWLYFHRSEKQGLSLGKRQSQKRGEAIRAQMTNGLVNFTRAR